MRRDEKDAQRAARRARRLAERAEERARRKERQAQRAAKRAERLSDESRQRPSDRDRGQSFEDMVDDFAEKAEHWIGEQARQWSSPDEEREIRRAERDAERAREDARRARENADRASRAAEDLSDYQESLFDESDEAPRSRRHYGAGRSRHRHHKKRRRSAHLYRDKANGKFLGVCAGLADYFGRATWEIRLYVILGLIFIPSVVIPAYFIAYFVMEDQPYYRRVTDRFDESLDSDEDELDDVKSRRGRKSMKSDRQGSAADVQMDNVQSMKTARDKFSNIEQRLREMESHVTSSRFELQREFRKISGEQ